MKTIRVKFIGFTDFDLDECDFYHILKKNYIIEESDNPDYVICSIFGRPYEYCKYDQIRIMCVGENYIPDFNVIDYAISPYPISFFDRNFYYPWCMHSYGRCKALQTKERKYDESLIKEKEFFANFIYGQVSENNIREDFFIRLSKYKRVESAGKNLNNMPNHMVVGRKNSGKIDFQKKCKFSICFESNKHKGFITEKIVDAFYADTIPIYYGSDTITTIFNKDAFINCNDYESFDEVIDKIIEIDNDDEKYLQMMNQPVFVKADFPSQVLNSLESFLINIFDQPLESAYRRSRYAKPRVFNKMLADVSERYPHFYRKRSFLEKVTASVKSKVYYFLKPFILKK